MIARISGSQAQNVKGESDSDKKENQIFFLNCSAERQDITGSIMLEELIGKVNRR